MFDTGVPESFCRRRQIVETHKSIGPPAVVGLIISGRLMWVMAAADI